MKRQIHGMRQRVAVLDPFQRHREYARRAVRGLGHAPLVFANAAEMRALGGPLRGLAMVFLGCAPETEDVDALLRDTRALVGRRVPILLAFGEAQRQAAVACIGTTTDAMLRPATFGDFYLCIEQFMRHHLLPTAQSGLRWGRYEFFPADGTVQLGEEDIGLQPLQFDLAMEFFHNVDRTLTPDWLCSMTACAETFDGGWLDSTVHALRHALDLSPEQGWNLEAVRQQGYRLSKLVAA